MTKEKLDNLPPATRNNSFKNLLNFSANAFEIDANNRYELDYNSVDSGGKKKPVYQYKIKDVGL